jgi:hypothetical protein
MPTPLLHHWTSLVLSEAVGASGAKSRLYVGIGYWIFKLILDRVAPSSGV